MLLLKAQSEEAHIIGETSWQVDDDKANELAKSIGTAILLGFLTMFALDEIVKVVGHQDVEEEAADNKESKNGRKGRSPKKGKSPT